MENILEHVRLGFVKADLDEDDMEEKMELHSKLQPELQGALAAAGLQRLGKEAATWSTMQVGVKKLSDVAGKAQRLIDYLGLEGQDAENLAAAVAGKPVPKPATKSAPNAEQASALLVEGPLRPPRRLRPAAAAAPDLLWQCMRKSSAFARNGGPGVKPRQTFSAEPGNLMSLHTFQFSGLANDQALDVRPVKVGSKERVELVQSSASGVSQRRPASLLVATGLKKCAKKGTNKLGMEVAAKFYRSGLHGLTRLKYLKVLQSFKKKKRTVRSRRAAK